MNLASRPLLVLFMTVILNPSQGAEVRDEVLRDLQRSIDDRLMRGAAVGVYDAGDVAFAGLGTVGWGEEREPGRDTAFEIGSVSKVFTALLVQREVEAGRLSWSDSMRESLPTQEFGSRRIGQITLRELAMHTSGLPRMPDNFSPGDAPDPFAHYDRVRLSEFLETHDPGVLDKSYLYSNLGMGILGEIGAVAGDVSYADAMQQAVLSPLALGDTTVGIAGHIRDRLAQGFSAGLDAPNWDGFDALAGAGALVSTTDDMLKFIGAQYEGSEIDSALSALRADRNETTALGWHVHELSAGDTVYWHNGSTGGYASFLALRPASRSGVVILSASTEADLVTELGFLQIEGAAPAAESAADLDSYTGTYKLDNEFFLRIFRHDDLLFGQATGQAAFRLRETGPATFVYAPATIVVNFEPVEAGVSPHLMLTQAGRETPAPRIDEASSHSVRRIIDVAEGELSRYVADYELGPGAVITVTTDGDALFAQLTGQPRFPVFAYAPDRFLYKVVDAQLEFERSVDGRVTALVLHQNGVQRAPRR